MTSARRVKASSTFSQVKKFVEEMQWSQSKITSLIESLVHEVIGREFMDHFENKVVL